MSTRSSIWLGESDGKHVHIYWELAERDLEKRGILAAPVYISIDSGDSGQETAIRLPKKIAVQLLSALDDRFIEEDPRVI